MTAPSGAPQPAWTPEQLAQASTAEIAAGRLPLTAQWRIAAQRQAGAFTSGLSVNEFAALRSVGFAPVGQVMGSAVYNIGWSYTGCGYTWRSGVFGGGWSGPAPVVDVPSTRQLIEHARHSALHRLRQECAGLGGDGVVGVQLTVESFYGNGLEFMATGTAVRALTDQRPGRPFTSDLTGQDFATLIRGGWLPVALVMGVGVALRHDDWLQLSQQSSWYNQELVGSTHLVHAARLAARASLDADVRRHGGQGVVLRDSYLNVFEVQCRGGGDDAHDHMADAFMFGTAIVPMPERDTDRATRAAPLTMLRLDKPARWRTE